MSILKVDSAFFRELPMRQKIRYSIVATSVLTLFFAVIVFATFEWIASRAQIIEDLNVRANMIASNSVAALAFDDPDTVTETLSALTVADDVRLACIHTNDGSAERLFASYISATGTKVCSENLMSMKVRAGSDVISVSSNIELSGERLGTLYIETDLRRLWAGLILVLQISLGALVVGTAIAFTLSGVLRKMITGPLLSLTQVAKSVSESRDYSLRATKISNDEVGQLIDSFNDMLAQIGVRESQLSEARDSLAMQVVERERANAGLTAAMDQLHQAQNQLVQTEKMASLGELVAGIAHEINTPVGVGVTAASTLKIKTDELTAAFESGTMTRSMMQDYTALAGNSTSMILKNLERAADLIRSFKQVAVDQSSSERRRFDVKQYIDEVLMSLQPRLKKTRHKVDVECPKNISILSYPGAFSQILTNLIMNSAVHAFGEQDEGHIAIRVKQEGRSLSIVYSDDGKGIPVNDRTRIYDPFFTTSRGSGGSGLGMHIVFNLVTVTLGGTIKLNHDVAKGIEFRISVPVEETVVTEGA